MMQVILNPVLRAGLCPECENSALHRIGCEYGNLEKALYAARKFIDVHAADPDLTADMCEAYAVYVDSLSLLPAIKPATVAYSP